jgi:putative ABC transport system substrate-binding protein
MASHIGRRKFLATLGGAAAAWPRATRAQQAAMPVIGFLGTATPSGWGQWVAATEQRLRELGWIVGRNLAIEYRWADGRSERYSEIAEEFVHLKVDVILTSGGAVLAAKQATSTIPIVFAVAVDAVGGGLVASLARPGGNATGLSLQFSDLAGKRLELLREFVPGLSRLAVLANITYPATVRERDEVQVAAKTLGLQITTMDIRQARDIAPAFDAVKGHIQAAYICADALVNTNRIHINILAAGARLPTMHGNREYVEAGGLISYGPNLRDSFRRAADYVDKILRGAKPAELPVEQPTKFDLVVNVITAQAIGLEIPPTLLARADEVIE